MTWLRNVFAAVARKRQWWWALVVVNLFGSLYGFYWYWPQLKETPRWQWPIVPDSPGSTLLLFFWLSFLLAGVDWKKPGMQLLGAVAFLSNMKYGLWTATVLPEAGIKFGWDFDFVHLSLSHFGMFVQGLLFARFYKPKLLPALVAFGWMYFQDVIDYKVLMTHPTLPYSSEFWFAALMAVVLSTVWGLFLVGQAAFDKGLDPA